MPERNRRDFFKLSALGGLAFGLGCSPSQRECDGDAADGLSLNDKLNAAFAGVGADLLSIEVKLANWVR